MQVLFPTKLSFSLFDWLTGYFLCSIVCDGYFILHEIDTLAFIQAKFWFCCYFSLCRIRFFFIKFVSLLLKSSAYVRLTVKPIEWCGTRKIPVYFSNLTSSNFGSLLQNDHKIETDRLRSAHTRNERKNTSDNGNDQNQTKRLTDSARTSFAALFVLGFG